MELGAIIAINNAFPAYCANYGVDPPLTGAALLAKLPPLNRWSDVVWTLWQDTAGKALAPSLQYIFRDSVVNDNSKHIMDVVMGISSPDPGQLQAPFPGKTFDVDTDDGAALLGTPTRKWHCLASHRPRRYAWKTTCQDYYLYWRR